MSRLRRSKRLSTIESKLVSPSIDDTTTDSQTSTCRHIENMDSLKVGKSVMKPDLWYCHFPNCNSLIGLNACLTCGYISCSQEKHSKQHASKRRYHKVSIDINSYKVYCHICNIHVNNDTRFNDISTLIESLSSLHKQISLKHKTRSGKNFANNNNNDKKSKIILMSNKRAKKYFEKDCLDNSIAHYETQLLKKTFQNWKNYKGIKRKMIKKRKNNDINEPPLKKTKKHGFFEGRTGLRNLGNTCYVNSIIQCLFSCESFRQFFLNLPSFVPESHEFIANIPEIDIDKIEKKIGKNVKFANLETMKKDKNSDKLYVPSPKLLRRRTTILAGAMEFNLEELKKDKYNNNDTNEMSLTAELYSLTRILSSGKWKIITPHRMALSIWNTLPQFRSYRQQDAQEFLSIFLDRLELEVKSIKNDNIMKYISNSFQTQIICQTNCHHCNFESIYKPPKSNFITLDLFGCIENLCQQKLKKNNIDISRISDSKYNKLLCECNCSLLMLLDTFCEIKYFKDDNQYHCSKCDKKQDASQKELISELPNCFIIHIGRGKWTMKGKQKLKNKIEFDLNELNLKKYCIKDINKNDDYYIYNLCACLVHNGRSMNQGHYICYCFNKLSNQWFKFNDTKVTMVNEKIVKESQPYLLFYERKNVANNINQAIKKLQIE